MDNTKRPLEDSHQALPFAGRLGGNQSFAVSQGRQADARPFAGRIGGNQAFTVSLQLNPEADAIVKETPDAAPLRSLKDAIDLKGFLQPVIWKAAVIECWGTSMLVFSVGLIANALGPYHSADSLGAPLVAALGNWFAITLFIFAAAPASGGHLNPFITMATLTTGLSTLSRSVLYMVGQCIGALIGAFLLKLGISGADYFPSGIVPGCSIDTSLVSYGQAYVLEFSSYLVSIFLSFGVGLDPRQGEVFGPALSPILIGLTVAFASFATGFLKEGWSGASEKKARDAAWWRGAQENMTNISKICAKDEVGKEHPLGA
ncbi:mip transporter [Diplodia corticola]|uniref:Mip transporter n=1 Tax=Diplodia corticola TaxID=236234 RepID=A0A1J9R907_9PEZI|nr:mip transporter [Diplodia corticola]OJD28907.1 mip transporter [Diplodia corticola]